MRRALVAALLTVALAAGGCSRDGARGSGDGARWWLGPLRAEARTGTTIQTWTSIAPEQLSISESPGTMRVFITVALPSGTTPGAARTLQLQFQQRLNGAKVEARGWNARQQQTLIRDRRFPGDTVEIPLGSFDAGTVTITIHRHLRAPPLLRQARVGESAPPVSPPATRV